MTGPTILSFPPGFLWGTATAAHHVEGNNRNNQWWEWEQQDGRVYHGHVSGLACNWWCCAEQDLTMAAAMGHNTHRLSVEWSRIEPEEGIFDSTAIARYRRVLEHMHSIGLEPMVTLHHFTDPLWLTERGGWLNPNVVKYFRRFCHRVVNELGDLVRLWITINEPPVYAAMGWILCEFPPGEHNPVSYFRVLNHMLRAHAAAYRVIHQADGAAQVGVANHIRLFRPYRPRDRWDRWVANTLDYLFNDLALQAPIDGRLHPPLGLGTVHGPLIDSVDFIGLNYYGCEMVMFDPIRPLELFGRRFALPGAAASDLKKDGEPFSQLQPAGLYEVLQRVARLGKPIYITENGLPDADDDQRPRFIVEHLEQVHRAIHDGCEVRGYYHWTLVDNFEWAEGWGLRFGLVELDVETQERRPRPSAELYSCIARANALDLRITERYTERLLTVP